MSKSTEPSNDLQNPYQSTKVEIDDSIANQNRIFSTSYWVAVGVLWLVAIAVTFLAPPFGIIGIATMCFVVIRSWMWAHRLRMWQLSGRVLPAPVDPKEFLLGSIGVGIAATLASAVAFVCTCVPIGFVGAMTLNFPLHGRPTTLFGIDVPTILFIGLSTACALFALWMAYLLMRATLPAINQEIRTEQESESTPTPN